MTTPTSAPPPAAAPTPTRSPALPTGLARWLPILHWLPRYDRSWLRSDVAAGLGLTALLVPQGMAYAQLAGLPPITGLYTSIMCLVAYAVFGPSRVLVLGPDSSLGPMIAASILPLVASGGDPGRAVLLASVQSVLVGVFMIAAGVAKLGFVADLLSKPTMVGYMNGLALTILVGQVRKLCGFSIEADGLVGEVVETARKIAAGATNPWALGVGVLALVILYAVQKVLPRVPAVLVAVIAGILASKGLDLPAHGVKVVGELPQGFPPLTLPILAPSEIVLLVGGALGITLVALADTISTASAYARRTGAPVDGNQEMVGIGTANVLAGFFQGFAVSTSGSRTAVAFKAGARSQVAGLVGAAAILLLLLVAPNLLSALPIPVLGAIVVMAAFSLAELAAARTLWSQRRMEFWLSIAATLAVAVLGVLPGIAVAVGLSILNVFRRAWWPYHAVLGREKGVPGYHDLAHRPGLTTMPGLVVVRFDAPLFFANARTFAEHVHNQCSADPPPKWILVAAEPISDIDTTAADMLAELVDELAEHGTTLAFAELKSVVRTKLERYEVAGTVDKILFFPTLNVASKEFRARYGTDWGSAVQPVEQPAGTARTSQPLEPDEEDG
ncbi:MAG TPA: sulfate permease [Dermatophilaceae bacterium]|nr:sulfate permease [Dermatophilaceae bacterium]